MNRICSAIPLFLLIVLLSPGCDTGLGPINQPAGFSGTIHFKNWPPADSVRDLRIVAFEAYPSDSGGIFLTLLAGRAAVYSADLTSRGSLPKFVDSAPYEFTTKSGINLKVQQYAYIVVAQQYGSNVLTDWRPAGVYTTEPNSFNPSPLRVLLHRITPNVDIEVDFHNPPPKPWR